MLRLLSLLVLSLCALSLSGCGAGNDDIAKSLLKAINDFADAAESGDKDKIQAAMGKFTEMVKEHKDKKVSASEKKRMDEQYKPQFEAAGKRLQAALMKAMTSGKLTQQDMMGIAQNMMNLK